MEQATSSLKIANRGVRIFLHSANEADKASETLWRMATSRKQGTPEADAIYHGFSAVDREYRHSLEQLRDRGALLHFRHAQVDYANGEYTMRGAR